MTPPLGYSLTVNGVQHDVVDAMLQENLLYVLRERLGLPGTKNACEQGECGACSVFVDGELVCSCLVLAASAVGAAITTIEVGDDDPVIGELQRAFVAEGGVQCGFCTPGLVMAARALLVGDADPDDLTVREAISGNLCRCTGYGRVLAAIRAALEAKSS